MKRRVLGFAVAAFAICASAEINVPLGTYIYAGAAKNYRNEALTADAEVKIQAVGENGAILAEALVVDPDAVSGVNFRLEVPVSSVRTAKSAAIGDSPHCVIVSSAGSYGAAAETFPQILCASCVTNCIVVWSDVLSFTNGTDVLDVPRDYIEGIAFLMKKYPAYDPWADWDGDGASNYAEYMAGTNPFDKSDYLRVTGFAATEAKAMVTFEYVGGHIYALSSARSLSSPVWAATKFTTSDGGSSQTTMYASGEEDVGEATLYVSPATDAPQRFFRVEVK